MDNQKKRARSRVKYAPATLIALAIAFGVNIAAAQSTLPGFVDASQATNSIAASSLTMSAPPNTAAGNVMFAQIVTTCTHSGYPTRIIPPPGWVVARYDITNCQTGTDVEQAIFWRVADTADGSGTPPPYTWNSYYWNKTGGVNSPAAGIQAGTIVSYANVNTKYPIDDHSAWITTSASNQLSAPGVYSSTNHGVLLVWYGYEVSTINSVDTPTGPAGMTPVISVHNGGTAPDVWAGVFAQNLGAVGWTPNSIGAIGAPDSGLSVGTAIALLPGDSNPIASAPPDPPNAGQTYYVDNSAGGCGGAGCSDSNSGTAPSSAWKTINKVNGTVFNPGDRILFAAGDVWREELQPKNNGSPGNPIIFSSFGSGPNPVISGANVLTGTWTQCTPSSCGKSSGNIWYQDIGSKYSYALDVYVTDVTQTCPGAACPALGGDPGWGLMRAADLPAGSVKAPGPKVNPRASGGSAQIAQMTAGTWLYDLTPITHRGM